MNDKKHNSEIKRKVSFKPTGNRYGGAGSNRKATELSIRAHFADEDMTGERGAGNEARGNVSYSIIYLNLNILAFQ